MPPVLEPPIRDHNATPAECRLVKRDWESFVLEHAEDNRTTPELLENQKDWIPSSDFVGFKQTVRQIGDLAAGDETDDYGVLRPTNFSFIRTIDVLNRAMEVLKNPFPRGSVTTDENGGIRIEWEVNDCAVRLVIPAEDGGQLYIYRERGDQYETADRVDGSVLASSLQGSW